MTLAVGIGATTAMFSALDAFFLRPLPYPDGDRIVDLRERFMVEGVEWTGSVSEQNFLAWKQQSQTLEDMVASTRESFNLAEDPPERIDGQRVTGEFFRLYRTQPALGRSFAPDDRYARVAVLSHGLWERRFGGDRDIVGRTIDLGGEPHEVIGVMPASFALAADVWVPMVLDGSSGRAGHYLSVLARLRPGVSLEAARGDLTGIAARLEAIHTENKGRSVLMRPRREVLVAGYARGAPILSLAVAAVLLIGCANVATLQLVRAASRRGEVAVRMALGASRWRLVRRFLTESFVLALLGGVLGILVALWCIELVRASVSPADQILFPFHLDAGVLAFALAASVFCAILFGLVPALQSSRADLSGVLGEAATRSTVGRGRLKKALVVAEVALSGALLVACGLLVRSMQRLDDAPLGFSTDRILTMAVSLPSRRYPDEAARIRFHQELVGRVEALPGVRSAAVVNYLPLSPNNMNGEYTIVGKTAPPVGQRPIAEYMIASPGYLQTMGLRLVRGRHFDAGDRQGSPRVAMVNQALVRQHLGGQDPIGLRLDLADGGPPWEIIGVLSDARRRNDITRAPVPEVYASAWQVAYFETMSLVARTEGDPVAVAGAIRAEAAAIDPGQAFYDVRTMDEVVETAQASRRRSTLLFSLFAAVALLLASLGIYGVMAYHTGQRRQELGIRMALGAAAHQVRRMVLFDGMRLVGLGLTLGLAGGAFLSRMLRTSLFEIAPSDPSSYALAALSLAAVGLLACWIPARRASRVDPAEALRG